eukprot:TRINITY_DN45805_c0_g1_i2.p3 TRINITY_DN45805_c0_g1~~TRINITY_DN45805_c0_g1_i2.p3  ORF type:complete len:140 (-),score=25.92 TRINITY_DN45805_c0_g1_i2:38-457(-)
MDAQLVDGVGNDVLLFTTVCAVITSSLFVLQRRAPPTPAAHDPTAEEPQREPSTEDAVEVTVRMVSGSQDIVVQLPRSSTARTLKDRCLARVQLSRPSRDVRLIRMGREVHDTVKIGGCLLYTSPSPRDRTRSRMPSSA